MATVLLIGSAAGATPEPNSAALDSPELAARALAVEINGRLRLENILFTGATTPTALDLERFEVFAPDARIVVRGAEGESLLEIPKTAFFKGTELGAPDSLALVVVRESGEISGFLNRDGRIFVFGQERSSSGALSTVAQELDYANSAFAEHAARWSCGNENHDLSLLPQELLRMEPRAPLTTTIYTADMEIETDYEFYALPAFGMNTTNVANYVASLVAGASAIYQRDFNLRLRLSRLFLYTAGAGLDPWTENTALCALFQLGNYEHANHSTEDRSLVHFLSGKTVTTSIAWLSTLCFPDIACSPSTQNCGPFPSCNTALPNPSYAGKYAASLFLAGDWNPITGAVVWDIYVFSHETGHNLGSPHTHCYGNYPNNGDPVIDMCYNGECSMQRPECYCGTQSLPATGGSIMSYCHLLSGGLSNISLYMGRAGFYGTNSERVNQRIRALVEGTTACLNVAMVGTGTGAGAAGANAAKVRTYQKQ